MLIKNLARAVAAVIPARLRPVVILPVACLVLGPFAAIVPASAAVQHPAAALATCTGGWPQATVINYKDFKPFAIIGSWRVGSTGLILDTSGRPATVFCVITVTNGDMVFRQQGTSNCVAFVPSTGQVLMRGCDESSANQQWFTDFSNTPDLTTESSSGCLEGTGADAPVFMGQCPNPDNNAWLVSFL